MFYVNLLPSCKNHFLFLQQRLKIEYDCSFFIFFIFYTPPIIFPPSRCLVRKICDSLNRLLHIGSTSLCLILTTHGRGSRRGEYVNEVLREGLGLGVWPSFESNPFSPSICVGECGECIFGVLLVKTEIVELWLKKHVVVVVVAAVSLSSPETHYKS